MKFRVAESDNGLFYPQFKPGLFRFWRFFQPDADISTWMLQVAMETRDPAKAAKFQTEDTAREFIHRVVAKVDAYYAEQLASNSRITDGVRIKRVSKVN